MPWLQASDLSCQRRGRLLFAGVQVGVQAGDILQIEGGNGAGKTTLLRILIGLLQPDSGQILWQGQPLSQQAWSLGTALAFLGHRNALKAVLTPLENLRWLLPLNAVTYREEAVVDCLLDMGLGAVLDQPCGQLSAGQQRRVALARVLLSERAFWVLDEPLTALDHAAQQLVTQRLRDHAEQGGAVILTAHQPLDLGARHQRLALVAA